LPAITCREEYQARPAIAIIHAALEHRQMEETPIRIAEPEPDDADWCARLMTSSEPWMSLGRDLTSCRESLGRPGTELLVARSAGVPVGFVLVAPHGLAGCPYIASIGVAAGARGRGIGSALLRFTEQHFAGRGHLFLLVSSFNDRAQRFYSRHGYERVGEVKDLVVAGLSEIILHKHLS
jgi:ribosomal protein S18 acetylase RimI-like enzyme